MEIIEESPLYLWSGEATLFWLLIRMLIVVLWKTHVQIVTSKRSALILSQHNVRINSLWYSQSACFFSIPWLSKFQVLILSWDERKFWKVKPAVCSLSCSRVREQSRLKILLLDFMTGQFFNNKILWHGWKHSFTAVEVLIQHREEKIEKAFQP